MDDNAARASVSNTLKCAGCGAQLRFVPGTRNLHCDYCGADNPIGDTATNEIKAMPYDDFLAECATAPANIFVKMVSCTSCGSTTVLDDVATAGDCPFCTAPLVVLQNDQNKYIRPHYVLPFDVNKQQATDAFKKWMAGLWWAPNDLAKNASIDTSGLKGVYLPFWTYDTDTETDYTGERGDYYYTTETYYVTVDGRQESRTRQVRHTRWSSASGRVNNEFTDITVGATTSLAEKTLNQLGPWRFDQLTAFDERYLSGFRSETYRVDPKTGFEKAKLLVADEIKETICNDIGGDEQRIDSTDTTYNNNAIKYVVLPVWASAYKYKDKVHQFTVNASTGEVIGERPLSAWKIALAIIAALVLIVIVIFFVSQNQQSA